MIAFLVILYLLIGLVAAYFLLRNTEQEGELHLALGVILLWPLLALVWLTIQTSRVVADLMDWMSGRW